VPDRSDGRTRIASSRLSFHASHFRQQLPRALLCPFAFSPLSLPSPVRRAGTCLRRACRKQDWRSPFAVARNKKCESIGAPSRACLSVSLSLSLSLSLSASLSVSSRREIERRPFRVRSGENNTSLGRPRGFARARGAL